MINSSIESNKESIKEIKLENNDNLYNKINNSNEKKELKRYYNKKKKNLIKFISYLKSIFINNKNYSKSNIRLMKRFWINKISEENIVQMDLKLYKLMNQSNKKSGFTHIHNLIDDFKNNRVNNKDYKKK